MHQEREVEHVAFDVVGPLGEAVQNLVAARLGVAVLPLAIVFAWGSISRFGGPFEPVALGAVVTAAAMLAYGVRIVQETLFRPYHPWMVVALWGSVIPPTYALFLLGWHGFRMLATASTGAAVITAILHVVLGVWILKSWMRVVEVERLARSVIANLEPRGGAR